MANFVELFHIVLVHVVPFFGNSLVPVLVIQLLNYYSHVIPVHATSSISRMGAKVTPSISVLFPPIHPLPHPHKSYESIHTFDSGATRLPTPRLHSPMSLPAHELAEALFLEIRRSSRIVRSWQYSAALASWPERALSLSLLPQLLFRSIAANRRGRVGPRSFCSRSLI